MSDNLPCPKCSAENSTSSVDCRKCGAPLAPSVEHVSTPDADIAPPGSSPVVVSNTNEHQLDKPAAVTVAGILGIITFIMSLILGLGLLIGGLFFAGLSGSGLFGAIPALASILGLFITGLACIGIAASVQVMRGYKWARLWLIGLSALDLAVGTYSIMASDHDPGFKDILLLIISFVIIFLLSLPDVQKYCTN